MADASRDSWLDRLPYPDGSVRRRFVAGGIALLGIACLYGARLRAEIALLQSSDALASPLLVVGALLLAYAIGSAIDLLSELVLLRAAAGLFWALGLPARRAAQARGGRAKFSAALLGALLAPFLAVGQVLLGLLGRTHYAIPLGALLTPTAQDLYGKLPAKVASGLARPLGDDAEFALKHLIDLLPAERDRQWAQRLINRAREIAAMTTSFALLAIAAAADGPGSGSHFGWFQTPARNPPAAVDAGPGALSERAAGADSWLGLDGAVELGGIALLALFLYAGFLASLRNAVVSIVESVAVEVPPSVLRSRLG